MSSCITTAFETYLQACITGGTKVALDEIVLAYISGLDHTATPPRSEGMPATADIVYRQNVDQAGKMDANAIAYSIVMDTKVGDFSFNAMYLINKASSTVAMVVYKQTETKIKTNGATQGNSIVKTMVMQYSGAALATGITVNANTWQVDMSGQLQALQANIDEKADLEHQHDIADINGLDTELGKKANNGHRHTMDNVEGLSAALDNKSNSGHGHSIANVSGLEQTILNLQNALNNKASATHKHQIADVEGLQDSLSTRAAKGLQTLWTGTGVSELIMNVKDYLYTQLNIVMTETNGNVAVGVLPMPFVTGHKQSGSLYVDYGDSSDWMINYNYEPTTNQLTITSSQRGVFSCVYATR
jgi:hypothetical protein